MQETTVVTHARQVYLSSAASADVIERAQVAIVTESAWHILGPARAHGDRMFMPMPQVTCPIVDITMLDESYEQEIAQIITSHLTSFGVRDVDGMIAELIKLGATVTPQDCIKFGSDAWYAALPEVEF